MRKIIFIAIAALKCVVASGQEPTAWRDSLTTINQQIATSPYSSDLHLRKAAFNAQLQQWEYAIEEYNLVLQKDATNPAALFYRAYANAHLRRYDLARNDYEPLLRISPDHLKARLGLSHILSKMGKKAEAMDQLNQLAEMHPDSAIVYVARAGLETECQSYDAALYDWDQAIRIEPRNGEYRLSKAELLILLGRKEEARATLDATVRCGIPRGQLRQWYARCK